MRKSRFTDEQIIAILKEGESAGKTGEVIRRHVVADQALNIQVLKDVLGKEW